MIYESLLNNFSSWALQVLAIGAVGAVLPALFRVRHPRSQLIYGQIVLLACLVLPLIQPWSHPLVVVERSAGAAEATRFVATADDARAVAAAGIPWQSVMLWVFVGGIGIRLCWIGAGLAQLSRYRRNARPLHPVPSSIASASSMTHATAVFCIAADGVGPVTFGLFRPVVLVPESFMELDDEAKRGIACHELLHVRRNDWLITLIEELIGLVLWFHPAIWWVLGQTRLAREQLVDAEVVRLTAARGPYINALLAMAGAKPRLDLAPAPLFLGRRHLLQRMHSLVTEVSMSRFRLFSSYVSIAAILGLAGWAAFVSFPLVGQAEVRLAPAQVQGRAPEPSPGYVITRPPISYPVDALQKGIEGQVVVDLTFNAKGDIIDSRVISGPEELRRAGLESALRGSYNIDVARSLQVVVNFSAAAARQRQGRGGFAPPPPPPPPPPPAPSPFANPSTVESIVIRGLEEPARTQMTQRLQVFIGRQLDPGLATELSEVVRSSGITSAPMIGSSINQTGGKSRISLSFGARISPTLAQNNLLQSVPPIYPPLARQARVEGEVVLEAAITREGKVENLKVVSGHPLLIQSAIDAVKQWSYRPVLLNGAPVEVLTTVNVNFALQ